MSDRWEYDEGAEVVIAYAKRMGWLVDDDALGVLP